MKIFWIPVPAFAGTSFSGYDRLSNLKIHSSPRKTSYDLECKIEDIIVLARLDEKKTDTGRKNNRVFNKFIDLAREKIQHKL